MIPPSFEYYAPTTLSEAIGLVQQLGPDAKILAGGMSLIPLMKLRLATPGALDQRGGGVPQELTMRALTRALERARQGTYGKPENPSESQWRRA